jgi:hypothetical protein
LEGKGYILREMQTKIDLMQVVLKDMVAGKATLDNNLLALETLDYEVFSYQEWTRLHESHAQYIVVNWHDGYHTIGLEKHIEVRKALFVYAPDLM